MRAVATPAIATRPAQNRARAARRPAAALPVRDSSSAISPIKHRAAQPRQRAEMTAPRTPNAPKVPPKTPLAGSSRSASNPSDACTTAVIVASSPTSVSTDGWYQRYASAARRPATAPAKHCHRAVRHDLGVDRDPARDEPDRDEERDAGGAREPSGAAVEHEPDHEEHRRRHGHAGDEQPVAGGSGRSPGDPPDQRAPGGQDERPRRGTRTPRRATPRARRTRRPRSAGQRVRRRAAGRRRRRRVRPPRRRGAVRRSSRR